MVSFFTQNLLWSQGIEILVVSIILIAIGFMYSRFLFISSLLFLAFSFFFFRNPTRRIPRQDNIVLAPSDGVITSISYENAEDDAFFQVVSIFLSPLDVHVNRAPFVGEVKNIVYTPGAFMFAFLPKSSVLNEHNDVWFVDRCGREIRIRQIAGFIARRICCWVSPFQKVRSGEPFGMIKFGSRVDIFLPKAVEITAQVGQRVWGGESIIGIWENS